LNTQRHNYILKTNKDLQPTNSRAILTSLDQVRNLEKVIPNVKMFSTETSDFGTRNENKHNTITKTQRKAATSLNERPYIQ